MPLPQSLGCHSTRASLQQGPRTASHRPWGGVCTQVRGRRARPPRSCWAQGWAGPRAGASRGAPSPGSGGQGCPGVLEAGGHRPILATVPAGTRHGSISRGRSQGPLAPHPDRAQLRGPAPRRLLGDELAPVLANDPGVLVTALWARCPACSRTRPRAPAWPHSLAGCRALPPAPHRRWGSGWPRLGRSTKARLRGRGAPAAPPGSVLPRQSPPRQRWGTCHRC